MEILPAGVIEMVPGMALLTGAMAVVSGILGIAVYVYVALALMKIADRTSTTPSWLAWIPIANLVLMAKIAKMPTWPFWILFAMIIPFLNILVAIALAVYMIIILWKICEVRNKPGWWAILTLIPYVGGIWSLILYGLLAWGKD